MPSYIVRLESESFLIALKGRTHLVQAITPIRGPMAMRHCAAVFIPFFLFHVAPSLPSTRQLIFLILSLVFLF